MPTFKPTMELSVEEYGQLPDNPVLLQLPATNVPITLAITVSPGAASTLRSGRIVVGLNGKRRAGHRGRGSSATIATAYSSRGAR